MDFDSLSRTHLGAPPQDALLGYYRSLAVGKANSEETRQRGASGGVVTALLTHLLDEGEIRGVLAVTMSEEKPWQCEAGLLTSVEEVKAAAQSKYSLVSLDALLGKARKEDGPFAVVGLPCHIHGLRRVQRLGAFREKFPLAIGLFCGFNLLPAATEHLVHKLGFQKEEVAKLQYREGDWPGGFSVVSRDGRRGFIAKSDYGYVNLMFVPRRCLNCPDLTNELADISVGDTWLHGYQGGWSTVVCRSQRGESLLKQATLKGVITLNEISREQMLRSHSHLFDYKKKGYFVRQRWLRSPLNYTLQRPSIGKRDWLLQSLLLGLILVLGNNRIRNLVARLPLPWLSRLSSWGRKGARRSAERGPTARR